MPAEPVLRAAGVTVAVSGSGTRIIQDVDLTLEPREVLGLVGESGSGKTTLSLALIGYARPGTELAAGSVRIDGVELLDAPEEERRRSRGRLVSYVPQDPASSINPAITVGRQLREALEVHHRGSEAERRRRIGDVLEKVQLPRTPEFLGRYPHQLSGGQQQRVCIAMAAVCRPRVIILDEPTTGLDVTTQGHVLEMLRDLIASEGAAALYVTHDLAVVAEMAQRLVVMYAGLLVEEGPAEAVIGRSAHPYSRRLIMATPSLRERRALTGIPGSPLTPRERADRCPFADRCEFVEPECRARTPDVETVAPGHRSRCRRAELVRRLAVEGPASGGVWSILGSPADHVLEVRGLSAWYSRDLVLHDLGLFISQGECLALVGESGSGKTTLARCVGGLHPGGARGSLRFRGDELALRAGKRSTAARRGIQYVFQNPYGSLNPRQTVGQLIRLPLDVFRIGPRGQRSGQVRQLLRRVALNPDYEGRYPDQLSGGERQRVAIARALAAEPRLLVCDEVTSSVDVSIQASILELLGQLRRDMDLTLLFITHNLAVVRTIADRVVILKDGRFLEEGPTSRVLDAPSDPYTLELLTNTPVLDVAGRAGG